MRKYSAASFGAATYPDIGSTPDELVRAADTAVREAKRTGKNRTVRASRIPPG